MVVIDQQVVIIPRQMWEAILQHGAVILMEI